MKNLVRKNKQPNQVVLVIDVVVLGTSLLIVMQGHTKTDMIWIRMMIKMYKPIV